MSKTLKLKIVTPERTVLEEEVEQVTIPTTEGEITVLPDHIPLVAALKSGDVVAKANGEVIPMAVSGGFIEVRDNVVAILADFAEHLHEISDEAVEKAKARAEELRVLMENKEHVDLKNL